MEREVKQAKNNNNDVMYFKGKKGYVHFEYEDNDGKVIDLRFYMDNIDGITGKDIEEIFELTKKQIKKDRIDLL